MSTRLALKQRVGSPAYPAVSNAITARTPKPRRPACLLQSRLAGRLGSVALEKLGHGQSGLKLDSVHRHGAPPGRNTVFTYSIDPLGCLAGHRCQSGQKHDFVGSLRTGASRRPTAAALHHARPAISLPVLPHVTPNPRP